MAFTEANATSFNNSGRGHGHSCGLGHNNSWHHGGHNNNSSIFKKTPHHHQKWENNEEKQENEKSHKNKDNICHRCGMKGH